MIEAAARLKLTADRDDCLVTRFNPATDSPETAKQMAAVMLMHGTEDQQRQALSTMNGAPDA